MSLRIWLLVFVVLLLIVTSIRHLIRIQIWKRKITKIVEHLPSPKLHPILGSGILFIGKSTERKQFNNNKGII